MRGRNEEKKKLKNESRVERTANLDKFKGKLTVTTLRLPERHKKLLEEHFENDGRSFSNGMRFMIEQYMKKEGLL